jgi:hypothetical protein
MVFSETDDGTHLHYVITFDAKPRVFGPIVRLALHRGITQGLAKYARR